MKTNNLKDALWKLRYQLHTEGYEFDSQSWQGAKSPFPFLEILHANFISPMALTVEEAKEQCQPFLPWADDHFQERTGGEPLNPPPSHRHWLSGTDKYFSKEEKFSHSYPERMWTETNRSGIRFNYGNLQTAVDLLIKDPTTRQCYIPMWFPEDLTAAVQGERVPCTFGWHFMLRDNALHCAYHMRSCDVIRHLHNDLYLCNRLTLWIIEQSKLDVKPGILHFSSTSLHCFTNDRYALKKILGVK